MLRLRMSALFVVALVFVVAPCLGRDGKDDVVGTIWSYTITRGDKVEKGQFRCYQKELFKGENKVGEVHPKDDDETTLVFTDFGELNGKVKIRKVKRKPVVWKGTLNKDKGRKWDIRITVKDR